MSDAAGDRRDRLRDRLFAWYWARRVKSAKDLRRLRREVLRRRSELDRIAARTEAAIARREPAADKAAVWRLRPEIFTEPQNPSIWSTPVAGARPARGLSVFHDIQGGAFTLSQRPNRGDGGRFELFYESYDFDGEYLSLAIAIPDALRRPKAGEALRLTLDCAASRPIKTYFRFNLSSTQHRDALNTEAVLGEGRSEIGFDMAFASFEPGEGDAIWLDLIFDRPRMLEFSIRDFDLRLTAADGA